MYFNPTLKYRIDGPMMVENDRNTQLYLKKERWLCSMGSNTNCSWKFGQKRSNRAKHKRLYPSNSFRYGILPR